jgi:alkanesulfonate monooxygenase SsuD/methylene tetrahydromethanopterin reductase-like flavin-dependent oxidoreductase (luciferase family)
MAAATERILLATTVANPVTRHVAVAAAGMASLQAASGGRARYGVGTGDSAVATLGLPWAGLAGLERHAQAFRGLVRGEEVEVDGHPVRLQWDVEPVPLWLAAGGPRTLRLAGAVADGVICGNGISEEVVRDNVRLVAEGARAAGRDPAEVEIWSMAKIVVADDEAEAWDRYAWTLAASANHTFRAGLEGKHVPPEHAAGLAAVRAGYDSRHHNEVGHGDAHADLVRDHGLTGWLGERFLIAGPAEHIRARVDALASWGAPNLILTAIWGEPLRYAAEIGEVVLGTPRARAGDRTTEGDK